MGPGFATGGSVATGGVADVCGVGFFALAGLLLEAPCPAVFCFFGWASGLGLEVAFFCNPDRSIMQPFHAGVSSNALRRSYLSLQLLRSEWHTWFLSLCDRR